MNAVELFPSEDGDLARTDPELAAVLENFALGEVLKDAAEGADLAPDVRFLVQLASMIAGQALTPFRSLLRAALDHGVTPVQVKEVVYQAVPYVGLSKVTDFLLATNEVLRDDGVSLPLPGRARTNSADRMEKGIAVQKQIVGADAVDGMYAAAAPDELQFQRYLSGNCFGDHVSRAGLDLQVRELLTFAFLVSLGGCEPQVKGHVAGNLNVGNTRADLLAVLTHLVPYIGYPRTLNGLRVLDEAAPPSSVRR